VARKRRRLFLFRGSRRFVFRKRKRVFLRERVRGLARRSRRGCARDVFVPPPRGGRGEGARVRRPETKNFGMRAVQRGGR
jgi:hypothetical protein